MTNGLPEEANDDEFRFNPTPNTFFDASVEFFFTPLKKNIQNHRYL